MRRTRWAIVSVSLVLLSATAGAQPAEPDVDKYEFKCMTETSKAGGKFVVARMKCVAKCVSNVWKGLILDDTACLFPYADPFTAACVQKADAKFEAAIAKKCGPNPYSFVDCPECYAAGDCGAFGPQWVATLGGQIDGFAAAVFCERQGAFLLEMRCQTTTSKAVAKYVAKVDKCFDKCFTVARKGIIPVADCMPAGPTPADPVTQACLATARENAVDAIDHDCHPPPGSPDACGDPYRDGQGWVDVTNIGFVPDIPVVYCASPGGAFVD
jgi:hypothetical protein